MRLADESKLIQLSCGGPGSGPHPGESYKARKTLNTYNWSTGDDDQVKSGTVLQHVNSTDKSEIFRHPVTGDEHSIDRSDLQHLEKIK